MGHSGLLPAAFPYSSLRADAGTLSVDVKNTGARDGVEVVQFYASYMGSKVERPVKRLVGFDGVAIARGQTKTVAVPGKLKFRLAPLPRTRG